MATATYTLSAPELALYQNYFDTMTRCPEFRQLVGFWIRMDSKYAATANNGTNALAPRSVAGTTGVVSIDTTDIAVSDQFPFFP